jgi:hypothetical protein
LSGFNTFETVVIGTTNQFDPAGSASAAQSNAESYADSAIAPWTNQVTGASIAAAGGLTNAGAFDPTNSAANALTAAKSYAATNPVTAAQLPSIPASLTTNFAATVQAIVSSGQTAAVTNGSGATGLYSIALGINTTAAGNIATAMGSSTTASGLYSMAMGYLAKATNDNTFVWADQYGAASRTNNEVTFSAQNGYRLLGGPIYGNGGGLTNLPGAKVSGAVALATAATNDSAGNNISLFYYPTSNPSAFISTVPVTATNQFLTTNVSLTITPTNGAASGTFTAAGALTLNLPLITNKVYYVSSEIAPRVFCTNNVATNVLSVTVPPGTYKYTASFTMICPTNTGFSGDVFLQGSDTCYGQGTRIKNGTFSYAGGATVYTEGWSGLGRLNALGVDIGSVIGCAYSSGIINVTAGHTYTAAIYQSTIDAVHPIYITNSFMLFEPIIR